MSRILAALVILATIGISCSAKANVTRCHWEYYGAGKQLVCETTPY